MKSASWRLWIATGLILALVGSACGSDDDDAGSGDGSCEKDELNLVTPGVLTVATGETAFPPWVDRMGGENFDDPTSKLGYEAAVVYEVALEMGFADSEVNWVRTTFDEAIAPGPKDFDFNIQQYSITAERDEVVDFSDPYYVTSQALVVLPDGEYADLDSIDDLSGARIGAAIATTSLDFAEEELDVETAVYDDNIAAVQAIRANQIDGIIVDLPTAFFMVSVQLEEGVVAAQFGGDAADPDEFGMLFAEGNSLVTCVNQALATVRDNGKLDEFADSFLRLGGNVPVLGG